MSFYEITFSPTGGTKKISHIFSEILGSDGIAIDLMDRTLPFHTFVFHPNDVCVVAVPSFGGRLPEIAAARLKQLTGGGAKAVPIVVYGNRAYEDTLVELQDILTGAGFRCAAAVAAIAEHSIMHQFAQGRPDSRDRKELTSFAEQIREKLQNTEDFGTLSLPGNRPYKKLATIPMTPAAGRVCNRCGLCAVKCPVGAIPTENPSKTDSEKCISCMGCTAVCPAKARKVNKLVLAAAVQKLKKACGGYKKNELFL